MAVTNVFAHPHCPGYLRLFRVVVILLYLILLLFGIILGIAGGALAYSWLIKVIPVQVTSGIFVVGFFLILLAIFGIVGVLRQEIAVLILANLLIVVIVIAQLGVGGAVYGTQSSHDLEKTFRNAFYSASTEERKVIEDEFGCCGWKNPNGMDCRRDMPEFFIEPCANSFAQPLQTVSQCCPPVWNVTSVWDEAWPKPEGNITCGDTEPRFLCCGVQCQPQYAHCEDDPGCEDLVVTAAEKRLGAIAGLGVVFGVFELIGAIIFCVFTVLFVLVKNNLDENEPAPPPRTANGSGDDDDDDDDDEFHL